MFGARITSGITLTAVVSANVPQFVYIAPRKAYARTPGSAPHDRGNPDEHDNWQ
jgi:hypothetical protein